MFRGSLACCSLVRFLCAQPAASAGIFVTALLLTRPNKGIYTQLLDFGEEHLLWKFQLPSLFLL